MNAVRSPSLPPDARSQAFQPGDGSASSMKWAALHEAAEVVAELAGIVAERTAPEIRNFPVLMGEAPAWRRELADRRIEDMVAMMEPGIAALLGVNDRGADPRPAALALWHEFTGARAALLALLPPDDAADLRRSA